MKSKYISFLLGIAASAMLICEANAADGVMAQLSYTDTVPVPQTVVEQETKIRVSSYKGSTLDVGERSGLMIGPSGTEYTVTSSDPDTVTVEQVMTFWVAVAKAEGTATITASNTTGESATLTLTVGSAVPVTPAPTPIASNSQTDEPNVRQELVRLINQTRKANGVSELPISEALMNAAQACSDSRYTWHHMKEECETVIACGYPYGFGINLTVFTGTATGGIAQRALENWINSPGHFETMIKPDCDSIGVGVTEIDGVTYCYMIVGRPNTHNPYEP